MKINLIVAGCIINDNASLLGIGCNGTLPWRLPKEMKHFAQLTSGNVNGKRNAVLMGRKTWESIPAKFRPLPRRFNIVLTSQTDYDLNSEPDSAIKIPSVDEALRYLKNLTDVKECWVIGGASIYNEFMERDAWDRIYLTKISTHFDCDTFFPILDPGRCKEVSCSNVDSNVQVEGDVKYSYHVYEKN